MDMNKLNWEATGCVWFPLIVTPVSSHRVHGLAAIEERLQHRVTMRGNRVTMRGSHTHLVDYQAILLTSLSASKRQQPKRTAHVLRRGEGGRGRGAPGTMDPCGRPGRGYRRSYWRKRLQRVSVSPARATARNMKI